ncbi:MAG: hypothetical protein II649_09455 [Kiritimatiellae bacterium]|nr:hypothetical protein [Kiritimatiellia bacterium]
MIGAFKQALPSPKAQKAVSSFLHQGSGMNVLYPASHVPFDTRNIESVDGSKLPGADRNRSEVLADVRRVKLHNKEKEKHT